MFGDLGSDPTLRASYLEAREALRQRGAFGAILQLLEADDAGTPAGRVQVEADG